MEKQVVKHSHVAIVSSSLVLHMQNFTVKEFCMITFIIKYLNALNAKESITDNILLYLR